jgi:hypothetical protein
MPDMAREEYHRDAPGQGQNLGLGLTFGPHPPPQIKGEGWGTDGMEHGVEHRHQARVSVETGSGAWCPDEQLRKEEQEAALMLSSMRGSAGASVGVGGYY